MDVCWLYNAWGLQHGFWDRLLRVYAVIGEVVVHKFGVVKSAKVCVDRKTSVEELFDKVGLVGCGFSCVQRVSRNVKDR